MIQYHFNINSDRKPLDRYWEHCIGSCHAATALREDYRKMLTKCHKDLGFQYLRFHGLFDDDMSVVSKPMFSNQLILSFTNIDNIFDFILSIGMKPFVELSFMPEVLASNNTTIFHYKGNTSPPNDYTKWAWFIGEFVNHIIKRYGRAEVRSWFFEIWNEPNLGGSGSPYGFWSGDRNEYFKLYKITAETVKKCDTQLKVGGPATSNNAWIPEFLDFCKESNAPVDFVTTHQYPTDCVLGYGVEDSANFVNPLPLDNKDRVQEVLEMAANGGEEFEEFKKQYSVFKSQLWRHVDRGVLTEMTKRAVSESRGLPLYYTEWGSLAGLESDSSFGASFIAKTVLDNVNLVKGYSFWTFCDIIEENAQDSSEFFGGFGLMTQHGIPKAPYRAFQLLHLLDGDLYNQVYRGETVDIYAVNNSIINTLQFLAVNHNSLLHTIENQDIEIYLDGIKDIISADITRIDDENANAYTKWLRNGRGKYLSKGQIDMLKGDSEMSTKILDITVLEKDCIIKFGLPPMGTVLINVYLN